MPVAFSLIAGILWIFVYLYKKAKGETINLLQNVAVTTYVIIYLMYPSITNLTFSLFNCFRLDDGISYLKRDFEVQCWEGNHARMALAIGLPFIAFWVIGYPVFIFVRLYRNRALFNDKDFIIRYGLFYVGLEDNAFFWEIIITNCRKVIFILCSTVLSTGDPVLKVINILNFMKLTIGNHWSFSPVCSDAAPLLLRTLYWSKIWYYWTPGNLCFSKLEKFEWFTF